MVLFCCCCCESTRLLRDGRLREIISARASQVVMCDTSEQMKFMFYQLPLVYQMVQGELLAIPLQFVSLAAP